MAGVGVGVSTAFNGSAGGPSTPLLDGSVMYWRAKDYSGSGEPQISNHDTITATFGTAAGADSADPDVRSEVGTFYFPGTAGSNLSIAGLSNSTVYDYTATYHDDSTADGTETSDGSGNLVLGEAQTNFDDKHVKRIVVVPDGGGATVEDIVAADVADGATSFTGAEGNTVTINRDSAAKTIVHILKPVLHHAGNDIVRLTSHADIIVASGKELTFFGTMRVPFEAGTGCYFWNCGHLNGRVTSTQLICQVFDGAGWRTSSFNHNASAGEIITAAMHVTEPDAEIVAGSDGEDWATPVALVGAVGSWYVTGTPDVCARGGNASPGEIFAFGVLNGKPTQSDLAALTVEAFA